MSGSDFWKTWKISMELEIFGIFFFGKWKWDRKENTLSDRHYVVSHSNLMEELNIKYIF